MAAAIHAPRLLDLFCGAGGCSVGYHRAGFDVTGVDVAPMHRYPFMDLLQSDALAVLDDVDYCRRFDVVHASPPCQAYSAGSRNRWGDRGHPDLVAQVRDALRRVGRPYVIENVAGAPLLAPVLVCGAALGLGAACRDGVWRQLRRHRLFESNVPVVGTGCGCDPAIQSVSVYGHGGGGYHPAAHSYQGTLAESRAAIEAPWMDRASVSQAIPPAYTEHLGRQLIATIAQVAR